MHGDPERKLKRDLAMQHFDERGIAFAERMLAKSETAAGANGGKLGEVAVGAGRR